MSNNIFPNEAIVTINGELLSQAESMTLRVALSSFSMDINHEGLGEDENGKAMSAGYLGAAGSIFRKMRKHRGPT